MVKLLTIDGWDTVLENSRAWDSVFIEQAHRVFASQDSSWSMAASTAAFDQEAQEFSETLERQMITIPLSQRLRNLGKAAGIELSESELLELRASFEAAIFRPLPHLVSGVQEFLTRVRSAGCKLGLVCNTGWFSSGAVSSVLQHYHLDSLIQFAVYSDQVGRAKPSSVIFEAVSVISGCSASEIVHIGDNLRNDVMGAINAGQYAIHLHRHGACIGQKFWCARDYDEVWGVLISHFGLCDRI
jgi:FMN phosphatase YigB (HAD superfamily)